MVSAWPSKYLFTNHLLFHLHFSAFLPSQISNYYLQLPLLALAVDGIEGEDFGQFGELFSSPQSVSCIHVIKLLFDFLPFICFMSILFLDKPEEPRWVEDNFFFPTTFIIMYVIFVAYH